MISCNDYDYIEIVCLHRYPIKLTLRSGEQIECVGLDTQRNDNREECIKVSQQETEQLVVLTEIATLEVCVDNPHFQHISFITS
ncbi:transcriptional regulator [Vibrio toranzoniae]|uniref:Transcriptional regulator n=1 Tax=Vibrio toranzoniae TaxID=1194427 RepID=A0A109DA86_9VIBR|nr:Rho-binding antiterminator [Vibrio toranzoniae]KWU01440.1 transcriptional regulator [Vibrio toranzoniae]NAZ55413.1 transcriptional regulator [Vibrio toranzoniae]SBS39559.1 Rho-binding antiterminator [Vibrio toranzoniae]